MSPIYKILLRYAPFVTLPVSMVIGAVGSTMEGMILNNNTPEMVSVEETRRKRQSERETNKPRGIEVESM